MLKGPNPIDVNDLEKNGHINYDIQSQNRSQELSKSVITFEKASFIKSDQLISAALSNCSGARSVLAEIQPLRQSEEERLTNCAAVDFSDYDCQVIYMQPHSDGMPEMHSLQCGILNGSRSSSYSRASTTQLFDQITLSVKEKDQLKAKNSKDVVKILAHHVITVSGKRNPVPNEAVRSSEDQSQMKTNSASTEEAWGKIQSASTDISADDEQDEVPPPLCPLILCPDKDFPERFLVKECLNRHTNSSSPESTDLSMRDVSTSQHFVKTLHVSLKQKSTQNTLRPPNDETNVDNFWTNFDNESLGKKVHVN